MLILVTNDDGVRSPGLIALAAAMKDVGDPVIVAPDRNRSAVGHALTLDHPLRAEEVRTGVYAVDGTPTDCVNLGIHGLLKQRPCLVVSGINRGSNVGDDITYSGTVSAALEASLMGLPSFAISYDSSDFNPIGLDAAAAFAKELASKIIIDGLPQNTFLNVNVPSGTVQGTLVTFQGKRRYGDGVVCNKDPRGRNYYWIGGGDVGFENIPGSDCNALSDGYISVTPLKTGMTNEAVSGDIERWLAVDRVLHDA